MRYDRHIGITKNKVRYLHSKTHQAYKFSILPANPNTVAKMFCYISTYKINLLSKAIRENPVSLHQPLTRNRIGLFLCVLSLTVIQVATSCLTLEIINKCIYVKRLKVHCVSRQFLLVFYKTRYILRMRLFSANDGLHVVEILQRLTLKTNCENTRTCVLHGTR